MADNQVLPLNPRGFLQVAGLLLRMRLDDCAELWVDNQFIAQCAMTARAPVGHDLLRLGP